MNHKNDIPYPTAEQKKRAVAQIVRQTKPPRVGAIRFLVDAYREIGMATVLRNSIGIFGLSAAVFAVGMPLEKLAHRSRQSPRRFSETSR